MALRVACLSGSRADWSTVEMMYRWLKQDPRFTATALALWDAPGALLNSDIHRVIGSTITQRAATALTDTAKLLEVVQPDILLVDGDRWEILAGVMAACFLGIPVAHLSGGDITEGSQDDAFRDAITELSGLHFPSNFQAQDRLVHAMGQRPDRVHLAGSPAVDRALRLEHEVGVWETMFPDWRGRGRVLVNFQAATLALSQRQDCDHFFRGLAMFANKHRESVFVFCSANVDRGSEDITQAIRLFCTRWNGRTRETQNLPLADYLGLLASTDVLVGNSSSGFYEAPCFATPTVNFGARQNGRIAHAMMAQAYSAESLLSYMEKCMAYRESGARNIINPYGTGDACGRIAEVLARYAGHAADLLRKR